MLLVEWKLPLIFSLVFSFLLPLCFFLPPVFVFFRMLSPPFLLSFSGFYSQRMPPLPGNKVTVIAGVMAMHRWPSVFFRSGEEDEQC